MSLKTYEPHKSSLGSMDANVMALLCYVIAAVISFIPYVQFVAWLVPLYIYKKETNSELVKFHAIQAFALYLVSAIISLILNIIIWTTTVATIASGFSIGFGAFGAAVVLSTIVGIISLIFLIFAIITIIKAYKYEEYSIPFFGNLSQKFAAKINK